jgi:tetratricopeptide (TPR) repeat protein
MYLRTPKRYQKQRRHVVSRRFVRLVLVTLVIVIAGGFIYTRQDEIGPPVREFIANVAEQAQGSVATMNAPTPLPTTDPSARVVRANEAWDRGAIEEALDEYMAVADAAPNNSLLQQRIALGLIMQGRGDEAVIAAERAVTADPFNAGAWAIRALAYDRAGQPETAIASALQSISLEPNNAPALAYMAEAYLDLDRYDLAQETIARALTADPNSYEANYVDGLLNWQVVYDLAAAQESFDVASDEAPNLPYITVDRAWLEWNLGNNDLAQSLLTEVLELNPTNLDALFALGYLYYQAYGDPNQAFDYIDRCVSADPTNIACLNYLGTLLTALGDTQGALNSYRRLMQTDTTNPAHFLAAGRAYMSAGDCSSAIPVLERGYEQQQDQDLTNTDRLALFEEYLSECGAPVFIAPAAEATEEAAP